MKKQLGTEFQREFESTFYELRNKMTKPLPYLFRLYDTGSIYGMGTIPSQVCDFIMCNVNGLTVAIELKSKNSPSSNNSQLAYGDFKQRQFEHIVEGFKYPMLYYVLVKRIRWDEEVYYLLPCEYLAGYIKTNKWKYFDLEKMADYSKATLKACIIKLMLEKL